MSDEIITTASGRKLKFRKLNVLDQAKLLRAIGPTQSDNNKYVALVQTAASIAEIDGVPLPFPTNERQIDAAIARLDDEGFVAVTTYLERKVRELEDATAAAQNAEDGQPPSPLVPSAS